MIRHAERRRETVVGDARGCLALFGSLFLLSGAFATTFALLGEMPGVWSRLGVLVIGLSHLGGGLFCGWGESRTAVVTRAGATVTHRRLFRATETQHVSAATVDAVEVEEGRSSDGDATFAPRLRRTTGRHVALTTQTLASREAVVEIASAIARRLALPEAVEW